MNSSKRDLSQGVLFLVLYIIGFALSVINTTPQNTLTEQGKQSTLKCCSNNRNAKFEWKHQSPADSLWTVVCRDQICQKTGYSTRVEIPGCSHLIVSSTSSENTGLYQCSEIDTEYNAGSYLVSYHLNCSRKFANKGGIVEGERLEYQCLILWNGKLPFEVRWLTGYGKVVKQGEFSEGKELYTSTLTAYAYRPATVPYTVILSFLSTGITDERVDKYSPSINSTLPEELVQFPVSNIRTSCPTEDCKRKIFDLVNCSADGYPQPEFHWLDWDGKMVSRSAVLNVTSYEALKYTCVATNRVNGTRRSVNITIVIEVREEVVTPIPKTEAMSLETKLVIGIVLTVVVVFIGAFLWLAFVLTGVRKVLTTLLDRNSASNARSRTGSRTSSTGSAPRGTAAEATKTYDDRDEDELDQGRRVKVKDEEEAGQSLLKAPIQAERTGSRPDHEEEEETGV